jgi:hypothetical protein
MLSRWRRIIFGVSAFVSVFVIVYVLFTHVLSATRMAAGPPQDFRESFGASDGLPPGYGERKRGDLRWAARGGILTIEGAGRAGDELVFTAPPRRFDDSVMTLRFRSRSSEPLEIFVGVEDKNAHAFTSAYVVGPTPFVHIGGEISGPYRSGQAVEDVRIDGGAADEWHTIAFQFVPKYSTADALLDGQPLISTAVLWASGVDSRITFGVRLRGDVAHANVEIDSLTFLTIDEALPSFDDTFNGEILDSQRWIVQYPDLNLATLDMHLVKGKGLVLGGRATGLVGEHSPFYFVRTPPFPLRNLRATADITVDAASQSRVFFGMMGSSAWSSADKVFDVGIAERDGKAVGDVTGAWANTGERSFEMAPETTLPHRYRIELAYDAPTATGTATIDGKLITQHVLDLKPLDLVSLRVGSGGHAVGAHSQVTVHRISVEMR